VSSSERNRLSQEILDTVPLVRIFAAGCLMLQWQRIDLPLDAELSPTNEEVVQFIERLDVRGLRTLRRIALGMAMQGGTVH
jgi:hypothetical protein